MGFFARLFGTSREDDFENPSPMPWDAKPSIYEHIQSHIDSKKPGLLNGGDKLPDDERLNKDSKIRWASGALDGVTTHHFGADDDEETARKILKGVLAYCKQPTVGNKAAVYRLVIENSSVHLIDPILEGLRNEKGLDHGRLHELAQSFATESSDREPVKFGVAILGLFGQAGHEELFQTLGRHDEFTLFCAVALANTSDDDDQSLLTLAKNVEGWGRVHVVERLGKTENPEIKHWMLREGYRNSVMYEYTACTCARTGGLLTALSEDPVDNELLNGAGDIIEALINGGPAEGIDDYEDGAVVVEMYLDHMDAAAESLDDFSHASSIKRFLDQEDADWTSRSERGWTSERRSEMRADCDRILQRPEWRTRTLAALDGSDEHEFYKGMEAAKVLGIETWDWQWNRLAAKPDDAGRWYQVMSRCNEDRIGTVIEAAEKWIDLYRIGTGAGDELGLGPGWEPHSALGYVLQELGRFPGWGAKLIQTGLKSPVVSNRNTAVNALSAWGQSAWSNGLRDSLHAAVKAEPRDEVRERMQKVLDGKPLSE